MKKTTKIITTIICLIISIVALYSFIFVIDVSNGWRITLIVIAMGWIVSGVSTLIECLRKG